MQDSRKEMPMEYRITDFGAVGDGKTMNTASIQKAVDTAEKAGGGRVIVPAGRFMSGTIWLKDNVELHLEVGAVLQASENLEDYNESDAYPQNYDAIQEGWLGKHFIIIHEKQNVSITGPGTIDGNGESFFEEPKPQEYYRYGWSYGFVRPEKMRPGQMISFIESKNIHITDVTLLHSTSWACHLHGCENVTIRGVHIFNKRYWANTDGIDIDTSSTVTVSDCIIDTGDDAITFRCASQRLRNGKTACEYVTVTNCVLAASASVFRLGVGTGEIRNINVSDIVIKRGAAAINCITAYSYNGCAKIENIRFSNLIADRISFPLRINQMNNGYVRNFHVQSFVARAFCKSGMTAIDKGEISDISIKDMSVEIIRPPFKVGPDEAEQRGAYAVETNGVRNVSFENVNIKIAEELKEKWKGMAKFTDSENIRTTNCCF